MTDNNIETKQFFRGALILTLAGLFSKILSAGYRIPLQNITGDLGFYIYQQIYPFLGIAIMLSLYGFPVAISKLVAELKDKKQAISLGSFYAPVFGIIFSLCLLLFLLIYSQAEKVARLMGDTLLQEPIRASSFVFLVLPFTSLLRGFFQGTNDMKPTAVSQIMEQMMRVGIILITAVLLLQSNDFYAIGTGAAVGSIAGAIVAAVWLLRVFVKREPWSHHIHTRLPLSYFLKTIFLYGLFICLNYMFLLLIQMADAFTLVPALESYGMASEQAKVMKGVFDRGQPLIQLGTVIGSSLALALIPTITKRRLESQPEKFHDHLQSALKMSLLLAAGATVGLVMVFPYVNELLYQDRNGTDFLRSLMIVILFSSLAITTSSVLQGVDAVYQTACVVLIGVAVKWIGNLMLVPGFGLMGGAWASVISAIVVLGLNMVLMRNRFRPVAWRKLPFFKLIISLTGMAGFLVLASTLETMLLPITSRFGLLIFTLVVSFIGAVIYFMLWIIIGGFNQQELEYIPLGGTVSKWISRRNHDA